MNRSAPEKGSPNDCFKMPDIRKIVLGVDTSLRSTGWGLVESEGGKISAIGFGTVKNSPKLPHSACLLNIHEQIGDCCRNSSPVAAAIEGVFFSKNIKTTLILGQARGTVISTCASFGTPVFEYSPREVKRALVGNGNASKGQVASMVCRILGIRDEIGEDESDALAIAICHLHRKSTIAGLAPTPI